MCTVLLPPGVNPIAVNKYIISYHIISKRKANWNGHVLRRNCLRKQIIEGKIKGEMEVIRRRGRKRRKLLDELKDRRGYSHLKEKAVDRTMWRNRFGGGFEPVVRQITEITENGAVRFSEKVCNNQGRR